MVRQISTGYKLYPQEWDADNKEIIFPPSIGEIRRKYLASLKTAVHEDMKRLKSIIYSLEDEMDSYTAENVVSKYRSNASTPESARRSSVLSRWTSFVDMAFLKKIGERLGLAIPLTTYVARHGWASIAKSRNIPISTISETMGHDSETTTRIYLASLDTSAVDKANSLILKAL